MGVRQNAKNKTREIILENTAMLLTKNGFIKVSSKEIAETCNVSQGTIFLHFKTKENLLITILNSNIIGVENSLKQRCITTDSSDVFLKNLLDVYAENEDILSRIYKDYPYFSDNLTRQIDSLDTLVKNMLFENFRKGQSKKLSIVDAFIIIDAFISQLKNYLTEKEVYSTSNSIIRQRRGRITKLYRMLFLWGEINDHDWKI